MICIMKNTQLKIWYVQARLCRAALLKKLHTVYYKTLKSVTVLPGSYIASQGEFKTVFSPYKATWNKNKQASYTLVKQA